MPRVRIIHDPLDLGTYAEHETDDVLGLIRCEFPSWPPTGHVYRDAISVANDVTPCDEAGVALLAEAGPGELFYVVAYPGDPITAIIAAVAVLALATIAFLFLAPKVPSPTNQESSNNSLGDRQNQARLGQRIEDIFGQVISIPSLLAVPLRVFEDNQELERSLMCVGRGAYDVTDVKDGATPLGLVAGSGASFYAPFTSPNNGQPYYTAGTPGDQEMLSVVKSNEVDGQTLRAPNANNVNGNNDIAFVAPDVIKRSGTGTTQDFTQYFAPGDELVVNNAALGYGIGRSTVLANVVFHSDMSVEFVGAAPPNYIVGDRVDVFNAAYTYTPSGGSPVTIDLTGTYYVLTTPGQPAGTVSGQRVYLSSNPPSTGS